MKKILVLSLVVFLFTGCCQNVIRLKQQEEIIESKKAEIKKLEETLQKQRMVDAIIIKELLGKLYECKYDEI